MATVTSYGEYVGKIFHNKWNEKFSVVKVQSVAKILVKFDNYEELIKATHIKSIKDGSELKTPFTKSVYGIAFLGYTKEEGRLLKISKKERSMWDTIIKRWSKSTVENEKYLSLKKFIEDLRELPRYNGLISTDRFILCIEDGKLVVKPIKQRMACKRIHSSGRTAHYASIEECADALGVEPRTIVRHIDSGIPFRGYTFKYIER